MATTAPPTPPDFPLPTDTPEDFDDKAYDCFPYVALAATNVYANAQAAEAAAVAAEDFSDDAQGSATAAALSETAAVAAASSAINTPGTNATSTSSITPAIGANAFTLAQTGKTFVVGQFVTVADATTPTTKFFNGAITAFNSGTGAITVTASVVVGTSSGSNWVITAAAPAQGERFNSPVQTSTALGNVSGTVNIDLRLGLDWSMTLTGNTTLTFTMPDLFATGLSTEVSLLVTKGGSYSLIMPVGTEYSDGTAPNPASGTKNEYIGTRRSGYNWIFALGRKNIA